MERWDMRICARLTDSIKCTCRSVVWSRSQPHPMQVVARNQCWEQCWTGTQHSVLCSARLTRYFTDLFEILEPGIWSYIDRYSKTHQLFFECREDTHRITTVKHPSARGPTILAVWLSHTRMILLFRCLQSRPQALGLHCTNSNSGE